MGNRMVSFQIDEEDYNDILFQAKLAKDVSVSEFIRRALSQYMRYGDLDEQKSIRSRSVTALMGESYEEVRRKGIELLHHQNNIRKLLDFLEVLFDLTYMLAQELKAQDVSEEKPGDESADQGGSDADSSR